MAIMTPEEKEALRLERKEKNRLANLERQAAGIFPKKTMARAPVATAKGQKQRIAEFKEMLLNEERGTVLIKKVLEVALNDEHPGQMTAIKMCLDRMLPTSLFEEKKMEGARPTISINISGIGESKSLPNIIEHDSPNEP